MKYVVIGPKHVNMFYKVFKEVNNINKEGYYNICPVIMIDYKYDYKKQKLKAHIVGENK